MTVEQTIIENIVYFVGGIVLGWVCKIIYEARVFPKHLKEVKK